VAVQNREKLKKEALPITAKNIEWEVVGVSVYWLTRLRRTKCGLSAGLQIEVKNHGASSRC
jgi:hypothetical protein